MKPRRQVSRAAIDMIKRLEGYRRKAARLSDGRWIVGYGHVRTARQGVEVSEADAEALLIYDLISVSHGINASAHTPLTQNEFDALVSFAFSIGLESFRQSLVLRRLNEGAHLQAACAMELWRKSEVEGEIIVVDALVRRRAAEKALFLTPPGAWTPAPSGVLQPRLDLDVTGAVPLAEPAGVTELVEGDDLRITRTLAEPQPVVGENPAGAAAEAVTARLSDLFREEAHELASPAEPEADSPFGPATGLEVTSAPDLPAPEPRPTPTSWRDFAPLSALALLGLALFVGGLFWAFRVAPGAGVSTAGALGVGWLAGVAGVGFFSIAAYRLFERIARAGEDEGLLP
jgi:lysozyme